jgi:hypothetical protein
VVANDGISGPVADPFPGITAAAAPEPLCGCAACAAGAGPTETSAPLPVPVVIAREARLTPGGAATLRALTGRGGG